MAVLLICQTHKKWALIIRLQGGKIGVSKYLVNIYGRKKMKLFKSFLLENLCKQHNSWIILFLSFSSAFLF